jgi:hypothetical protein
MTKAGTVGCMLYIFDLYIIWLLISTVEHITHTHTHPHHQDTGPLCTLGAGPSSNMYNRSNATKLLAFGPARFPRRFSFVYYKKPWSKRTKTFTTHKSYQFDKG